MIAPQTSEFRSDSDPFVSVYKFILPDGAISTSTHDVDVGDHDA